jgi:hypothetical protein
MKIELSQEEHQLLILALGMASGVALRDGDAPLFRALQRLANTVNKDNPNWKPYAVQEES